MTEYQRYIVYWLAFGSSLYLTSLTVSWLFSKIIKVKTNKMVEDQINLELMNLSENGDIRHLINKLILKHKIEEFSLIQNLNTLDDYYHNREYNSAIYAPLDRIILAVLLGVILDNSKTVTFYNKCISLMLQTIDAYEKAVVVSVDKAKEVLQGHPYQFSQITEPH